MSGNQYIYWGHKNEANIADWFQEDTGKKVRKLGTLRSRAHPFMLANVDRVVVGENAGLEIKTAGVSQYKKWQDDDVPDSYYCQCLHYMAVTGAKVASDEDCMEELVYRTMQENHITDPTALRPGQVVVVHVKEIHQEARHETK